MAKQLIVADAASVARVAADSIVKQLQATIRTSGRATWVIAGGSSPVAAYRLLAAASTTALDWTKVTIVIGDERCVPFDSPEANWTLAHEVLFKQLQLSDKTRRPATDLMAEQAADQYERYLRSLPQTGQGLPKFDQLWLGMGVDGHTLSLFPDHESSQQAMSEQLVIAVHDSPKPPPDRISLTLTALQGVSDCLIMVAGVGKSAVVARAIGGDLTLPIAQAAAAVEQAGGRVTWLLDEAAAAEL